MDAGPPVASDLPVRKYAVVPEDGDADEVEHQTVVEAIADPRPEVVRLEEDALLTELIQLRISIEQSCIDKLIEDAQHERWHDREDDVEERQRPRLVNDLSREGVEERIPELRDE